MSRLPSSREVNHAAILGVLRDTGMATRTELERTTGLGRKIISERVQELIDLGFASEGGWAQSTGGRMPREISFGADLGLIGVAEMNVHHLTVGLTDLSGRLLLTRQVSNDIAAGPTAACSEIERGVRSLLEEIGKTTDDLWGVGVGVTAPVDAGRGRIAPGHLFDLTTMAGWDGYPVRDHLVARLGRPVWVNNEVNLMALGELRAGRGRGYDDIVFAKLGPGIGGGLVMGGALQQGVAAAGELGHLSVPQDQPRLCWCGARGCLFTFVEEKVLLAEARGLAIDPDRPPTIDPGGGDPRDLRALVQAAAEGSAPAAEILARAGRRIGAALASVVTLLNPQLLLLGGTLVAEGNTALDAIRAEISGRAMRHATEQLIIEISPLSDRAGLVGAAFMVADALFTARALSIWLDHGSPRDHAAQLHAGH